MSRVRIIATATTVTGLVACILVAISSGAPRTPSQREAPSRDSVTGSPPEADARVPTYDAVAREADRIVELHARIHGEQPRDPSWSREHEEHIVDHLASETFAGTSLESVDCRTSRCRVVVVHRDEDAAQRLSGAWGRGPFAYGGFSHFDERTRSTTLYLGREGYELFPPDLAVELR